MLRYEYHAKDMHDTRSLLQRVRVCPLCAHVVGGLVDENLESLHTCHPCGLYICNACAVLLGPTSHRYYMCRACVGTD